MVQTNQNLSFIPSQREGNAEALLIRLHEVDNVAKLAKATFEVVQAIIPYQFVILLFRPLEFDLPCRFFPLKYKPVVDGYMASSHKNDIWLRRSPVNPQVKVVRHSDFTSSAQLHRSAYYKAVLRPLDSEFGASLVAWRDNTWLATLTVMRNKTQGDFSDAQMQELLTLQPHFSCVIRRMAGYQETRLIHSSLSHFMSTVPTATIILDWNLKVLHYNSVASQLCSQWKSGTRASLFKAPRRFLVPGDILARLETMRPSIMKQKWTRSAGSRKSLHLIPPHRGSVLPSNSCRPARLPCRREHSWSRSRKIPPGIIGA